MMIRAIRCCALLAAAAVALAGCTTTHSENFLSVVITTDNATHSSPLRSIGLVTSVGDFGAASQSSAKQLLASEANGNVRLLFAASEQRLPAIFALNGLRSEAVATPADRPEAIAQALSRFEAVLVLTPLAATRSNSTAPAGLRLRGEILDRQRVAIWRGFIDERLDHVPPDRRAEVAWNAEMADDMARTLLEHWAKDGVVKLEGPVRLR